MSRSRYGRFRDGVQISGMTLNVNQKGKVYYVCNSTVVAPTGISGSNGNDGLTPEKPLATIAKAVSLCVAGRGDKIICMPGHAETISAAAGIDLNVAGIMILGQGVGADRPTITLGTANTATLRISAANIRIENVLFVANFLNIATCIDVTTGLNAQVVECEFRDSSAILNFVKAVRTSSTDNAANGLMVKDCFFLGLGTSAATALVHNQGANDRMVVEDNKVFVQGSTATTGVVILSTSKAMTGLSCQRNLAQSLYTGSAGCLIVGTSGSTGVVANNFITITGGGIDLLCTASTGLGFYNNYIQSAADKSGTLSPIIE